MPPKISLIYLTYRPGGFDVLVDSLINQTFKDWELIVVDDYPGRELHETAQYLKEHGIEEFKVSRSKAKCFPEIGFNLINAYNTGVMLSEGDLVAILNDYTWLPPYSFERIMDNYDIMMEGNGTCLTAIGDVYDCPEPPHLEEKFEVWDEPWTGHPGSHGLTLRQLWIPTEFELFYSVFPYFVLEKINGFLECFDYANNNQIVPFVQKCLSVECRLGVDNELHAIIINHRDWGNRSALWHLSRVKPSGETNLHMRENTFDLKTHKRGTLP